MSLVAFHKVLITTAILFCAAFSAWQLRDYTRGGGWLNLVVALGFAVGTLGLALYLSRLEDFLGRGPGD